MIKPTEEQESILLLDDCSIVNAFAGTGKTTSLFLFALKNKSKKILYLCYNKTIQQAALGKFPKNVVCSTAHSIAYKFFGYEYQHKLVPFLNNKSVLEELKISPGNFFCSKIIIETLSNFLYSNQFEFTRDLVPIEDYKIYSEVMNMGVDNILSFAEKLWEKMLDKNNSKIGMLHDGYLKLFQLNPQSLPYDIILLDEAQDANPCILSVIEQQDAMKILVGDSHQSIYKFRGSIDALKYFDFQKLYLTNSFRFGSNVADIANYLLYFNKEKNKINGLGNSQVSTSSTIFNNHPHVVLSRSNLYLIEEMIRLSKNNIPFTTEGKLDNYGLKTLRDVYSFKQNKKTSDPFLSRFSSFKEFETTIINSENKTYLSSLILIQRHNKNNDLETFFDNLDKNYKTERRESKVLLTNAHQSKGKEYGNVLLLDSFDGSCFDKNHYQKFLSLKKKKDRNFVLPEGVSLDDFKTCYIHPTEPEFEEENNIAYVAITRAANKLVLPFDYHQYYRKVSPLTKIENLTSDIEANYKKEGYIFTKEFKVMLQQEAFEKDFTVKEKHKNKKVVI